MRRLIRWIKLQNRREERRKRNFDRLIRHLAASPYRTLALADGRTVEVRRVAFMLRDGELIPLGESKR